MNNIKVILISIAFCIISFFACNSKKSEYILSRDKMVAILHDIQLAEAIYQVKYNDFVKREQKDALLNDILKKHNITQSQLDSSLVWYADNAEIYMKVNDSIISTLKTDIQFIETKNLSKNLGVNRNNYIIANHVFLNKENPIITFSLDSLQAENYQAFDLKFSVIGFLSKLDTIAEFSVMYTYQDTVIIDKQQIVDNTFYHSLNSRPNDTLKNVVGYIYVDPNLVKNNNILIYDIKIRDNKEVILNDN